MCISCTDLKNLPQMELRVEIKPKIAQTCAMYIMVEIRGWAKFQNDITTFS